MLFWYSSYALFAVSVYNLLFFRDSEQEKMAAKAFALYGMIKNKNSLCAAFMIASSTAKKLNIIYHRLINWMLQSPCSDVELSIGEIYVKSIIESHINTVLISQGTKNSIFEDRSMKDFMMFILIEMILLVHLSVNFQVWDYSPMTFRYFSSSESWNKLEISLKNTFQFSLTGVACVEVINVPSWSCKL